jgi:hypothetical protein
MTDQSTEWSTYPVESQLCDGNREQAALASSPTSQLVELPEGPGLAVFI